MCELDMDSGMQSRIAATSFNRRAGNARGIKCRDIHRMCSPPIGKVVPIALTHTQIQIECSSGINNHSWAAIDPTGMNAANYVLQRVKLSASECPRICTASVTLY